MKKFSILFLIIVLILSFSSCKSDKCEKSECEELTANEESVLNSESGDSESGETLFIENDSEDGNEDLSEKKSVNVSVKPESEMQTVQKKTTPPTSGTEVEVQKSVVSSEIIEQPKTEAITQEVTVNTNHTPISESDYYQLNTLSGNDRNIYSAITNAVESSKNIVDLSAYKVSEDKVVEIFQKILADYPQYFYISRSCTLVYSSKGSKEVKALVILYTDGTTVDEFDSQLNMKKEADRNTINGQISALNSKIKSIVNNISADYPDIIKEKLIYDYVIKSVSYEENTQANTYNYSHSFDIYGAAVNGKSVCEGYAKMFQYLCYSVGINSTQVSGKGMGGNHKWNTVLIENEWYQADPTWDDTGNTSSYIYFNITSEKMSADHSIDSSVISVPNCNSTKNSFINQFALYVSNLSNVPDNYEKSISTAKQLGDKKLYLYIEGYKKDKDGMIEAGLYMNYIKSCFFSSASPVYSYLTNQGITLDSLISINREYIVLSMNY